MTEVHECMGAKPFDLAEKIVLSSGNNYLNVNYLVTLITCKPYIAKNALNKLQGTMIVLHVKQYG